MQRIFYQYIDLPTWNLTRLLRVLFGAVLLVFGIANGDNLTSILAGLILLQGVFNVGCMGGACAVPRESRSVSTLDKDENA
jgi:hypothetical protein